MKFTEKIQIKNIQKALLRGFFVLCLILVAAWYGDRELMTVSMDSFDQQNVDSSGEQGYGVETVELDKDAGEVLHDGLQHNSVINVLLIGTDEQSDGSFSDNARSDALMLLSVNVNEVPPMVSFVSLERAIGVPILEGPYTGQWDWLTHTFRYGGADLLMAEIRECLKVDVTQYVRINFQFFVQAIDLLGGVTVNFDEKEAEVFRNSGMTNAVVGNNHLNGTQALQYARLRSIDSDWVRIQRQREIVLSLAESCRGRSLVELYLLLDDLRPLIQTNISDSKIIEFAALLPKMRNAKTQQMTIPATDTYDHMIGMDGRSLFAVDFDANAKMLREFLYSDSGEETKE